MILGSLQMNVMKNKKELNLAKVDKLINELVDLVVLPELFSTGYFFETRDELVGIAEKIPNGFTTKELIKIAERTHSHLIGTIVEREDECIYITSVIVGPLGYIGKHRKRHLTKDESNYYVCGETSDVYEINGCKIGIVICFEGWFPESMRALMLKGTQIVCCSLLTTSEKTIEMMRTRAIENKVYLIMSNSISTEIFNGNSITFMGDSRIIDYRGNVLVSAGKEEKLILTDVDEKLTINKDLEDCDDLVLEIRKHGGIYT